MTEVVTTVLAAGAAVAAVSGLLTGRAQRVHAAVTTALLALALVTVWFADIDASGRGDNHLVTLLACIVAVAGGGLVTTQVFALVDADTGIRDAGAVLRGGAWIGALERLAVFATLVVGWGPGIAVVLAVKGLGRYPELRNQEETGAAERFIIGTFTSVLWAAACAALSVLAPG
jgi:hypothetical protein